MKLWQDFYAHADHFADLDWNSAGSIPLTEWLCAERGQEEKDAFNTMGNIVVPQQAFTAWCILTRLHHLATNL